MLRDNQELAQAIVALQKAGCRVENRTFLLAIGLLLSGADGFSWIVRRLFLRKQLLPLETQGLLRMAAGLNKVGVVLLRRHLRRYSRHRA
ncbi:hypothetical protein [Labrys sp. ZIDIC5]|uniref:hypothetical protein n=1 Tax=Labrys sedimenti TaxID=3106036 RepID=UPI002ACB00D9|nr:hypothetical protein [Labrys sp. ZIDIC5]MDZ5452552.1 hypothetical protein [Labrys sp. ZIDIC5]